MLCTAYLPSLSNFRFAVFQGRDVFHLKVSLGGTVICHGLEKGDAYMSLENAICTRAQ